MNTISKQNIRVLLQRRDFLLKKVEEGQSKNKLVSYEKSEIRALDKALAIVAEFITKDSDDTNGEDPHDTCNIPQIAELVQKGPQQLEKTVIKEFIRSQKSRLQISKERRGEREYISFQNIHLDEQTQTWKATPKTSIKLSEVAEIIAILNSYKSEVSE